MFRLLLFVARGGIFVRPSAGRLALSGSRRPTAACAAAAVAAAAATSISAGDNRGFRGGVRKVAGRHRRWDGGRMTMRNFISRSTQTLIKWFAFNKSCSWFDGFDNKWEIMSSFKYMTTIK